MNFILPENILKQHGVVLGKTGSGKSSSLRYLVEHLLDQGKRVCVVDPKGDWHGLKVSGDGKHPGYPIIAFGDFKEPKATDVPINAHSGKHIAELITSGNRPCIIGMRGWMPNQLVKFWLDFAPALFNAQSGELYLVIDEVHNFAPKGKILDPDAGRCIHWTNRLMSEGRGLGLIMLIASQRPQKVHNDTLTCCETLIAMRVIHKADRNAVKDWIDGCGDSDKGNEVLNGLAQLDRGEAWVWSPEAGFGPKRIKFPLFKTFDSFAPPQLQKKISGEGWSTVNLDDVKAKLASVIEEAKANDPVELKREIARLNSEMKKSAKQISPKATAEIKTVHMFSSDEIGRLVHLMEVLERLSKDCGHVLALANEIQNQQPFIKNELQFISKSITDKFSAQPQRSQNANRLLLKSEAVIRRPVPANSSETKLGAAHRKFLTVLANRQGKPTRRNQIAVFSGYSSKSSHVDNTISSLRTSGYVSGSSDNLMIEQTGLDALGKWDALPTGQDLINFWIRETGSAGGKMLAKLVEVYPHTMTRDELAEATGFSVQSSHVDNTISNLRTLELVTGGKQDLKATEEFFQ